MKMIARLLLVLLLAGAGAIAVVKQNAIAAARAEQQALRAESDEARRLADENNDLPKLRTAHEEVEKLRAANKDLPRLRNEVRQLRRETVDVAELRAVNQLLKSALPHATSQDSDALPADFISRAAMADVGMGTPEAAIQTYLWCLCTGNFKRFQDCAIGARSLDTSSEDWILNWQKEMQNRMKNFPGFRIAGRQDISPDTVDLTLETKAGGATRTVRFKMIGNDWISVDGPPGY